jgi:hypothetical protein
VGRHVAQPLPLARGERGDEHHGVAEQAVDEPQQRPDGGGGDPGVAPVASLTTLIPVAILPTVRPR